MSRLNKRLFGASLLVALVAIHLIYDYYFETILYFFAVPTLFQAELFFSFADILKAAIFVLLFKKFCPEVVAIANNKLLAWRKSQIFGLHGGRRFMIVSAFCVLIVMTSGAVRTIQTEITKAEPLQPTSTELYGTAAEESTLVKELTQDPKARQILARSFSAAGEELLYRWFLLRMLMCLMPVWVAVIASSAIFGFAHFEWSEAGFANQMAPVPAAFLGGIGFSFAYLRNGLLYSSILHWAGNLISQFPHETVSYSIIYLFLTNVLILAPILLFEVLITKLFKRTVVQK